MEIKTTARNRKDVVNAIREFTGEDSVYLGPPTFAYQVGNFTIDRDGTVIVEEEVQGLAEFLLEKGVIQREIPMMDVVVTLEEMTATGMRNLVFLLHSKQYLLNRMVGSHSFDICEKLIGELEEQTPKDLEGFFTLLDKYEDRNCGFSVNEEKITFSFPVQELPEKNTALTELMANMVRHAKTAKRINPKLIMEENEKYYLRSWLLRTGFSGKEAKEKRKILLEGLKGHTAFRTPQDEEKWKAARAAVKEKGKLEDE